MKINIVCVGKIKEKFFVDAIAEYAKRLSKYCSFEIIEVPDEKTPDKASEALEDQIKEKEGKRILAKIKDDAYVCTLEIKGKKLTSPGFADLIEKTTVSGKSNITFVIGGSLGLGQELLDRANYRLKLSDMTFLHQMTRLILVEQIYRSFKILNHETYHK